ncbi:hypothetical protein P9112_014589 [Eukaryota sp. TZLM1-RC]
MVQELFVDAWNKCFPSSLPSVPSRSLSNLHLDVIKLQQSVLTGFENLFFSQRLSMTKIDYPVFAAFLSDIQNCTSLISQQPRPFGLHLINEAWKHNTRLRLGFHIFCSTELGGLDFHKPKYFFKAAFIGGGKNFVFEFLKRFPENQHLIECCVSDYLVSLQSEIECISPHIWSKCFPADIQEIPPRSLISLKFAYAKLQKKILKVFENLDFTVRLSLAKEKNPVFANFLIDLKESSSSCLIPQIPNVLGLVLNDHQWTTAFRMRSFLWPCSVPNDLICRCGQLINLNHLSNCKFKITYRSVVHDAVRDQLYAMCKSHHIEAFVEPLVRRLSSENEDENTFGKRRADLISPASDGVILVVDVVTVDVWKDSAIDFAKRDDTQLCFAEKCKIKKYNEPLSQLGRVEHVMYQLVPFAVSLFGNIGISGIKFLEGFRSLIKKEQEKN